MNWSKVFLGLTFCLGITVSNAQSIQKTEGAASVTVLKRSPLPTAKWLYQQLDSVVTLPDNVRWSAEYCAHFDLQMNGTNVPKYRDACKDDLVILHDNLALPAVYLQKESYYAIWDSKNLDSYGYDIRSFTEDVKFELYNLERGEKWHAPILDTRINSKYGMRRGRWHHGTDLDLEIGDPVYAAFDGVVRIAKVNRGGYGKYVLIRHKNGMETLYGHLNKYVVKEGTLVKAGDIIGEGGNTGRSSGPHLHFEVRYRGHSIDPIHLYDFKKDKLLTKDFTLTRTHYADYIESLKAQYCRVRSGDSLWRISRRYGTSIRRLCKLNGISRRTTLRIGRRLRYR